MFKGVRAKVENEGQYKQYLEKLEPVRQELGVSLQEELYPKNE
jgi:cytochrome c oxidase subunit 5a